MTSSVSMWNLYLLKAVVGYLGGQVKIGVHHHPQQKPQSEQQINSPWLHTLSKHDVGFTQQPLFFHRRFSHEDFYLKWSLRWGRHVHHHQRKQKFPNACQLLNLCVRTHVWKVLFFMLNDYTINLTNGINQTTPAPGVRLGPIYDEAWERNSVFYLFYHLAFTRRGVGGTGLYGLGNSPPSYNKSTCDWQSTLG